MSQRLEIQRHLAAGHSITPLVALRKFGCLSLSQRIGQIKRDGFPVVTKLVKVGPNKRVAEYRIKR